MVAKRAGELVLVALAIVALVVLSALRASQAQQSLSVPSTYDSGLHGYGALYEFLARQGVPVARYEQPFQQIFSHRGTLIIAGDDVLARLAFAGTQLRDLDTWVRAGRTLVLIGSPASALHRTLGMPTTSAAKATLASAACGLAARLHHIRIAGDFTTGMMARACDATHITLLGADGRAVAIAYRRGAGVVIVVTTPQIFDNVHLAQRDNAAFAYALFSGLHGIAFDEAVYGHEVGGSFWSVLPVPMHAAIILACIVVLLAIIGANLPFAPPYAAPAPGERDSAEYIASLAHMLQRGGARRETVVRLCTPVRVGLAAHAGDERAAALSQQARALEAVLFPTEQDVAAAGLLFWQVRKEYT